MKLCNTCVFWAPNQETVTEVEDGKYECRNPEVNIRTPIGFGCSLHLASTDTAYNVPDHAAKGTMTDPNPSPVDGPVEVLIVTYWKDFEWLRYTLRSIWKYFTGFQGVTVACPTRDRKIFEPLWEEFDQTVEHRKIRLNFYDEVEGKGMVQHMVKMAEADLIVPPGTKYVLHTDADGIFKMPTTPEHFFANDKPYYLIRSWSSLGYPDPRHPVSRAISDCAQWKAPTDTQLGWNTEWYTMCLNTAMLPIDFYKPYREHVASVHRRPFTEHMLAGRNEFPQTSMDWTSMGAWAHKFFHDRLTWFDVEHPPHPVDRKKAYHSHSGFTPEIRAEIEGFLA